MTQDFQTKGLASYVTGFGLSLVFTLIAYWLVVSHQVTGPLLVALILGMAILQLAGQLFFFLDFGRGANARWKVAIFLFAALVVVILVGGSLWIMANLNYNMTPQQIQDYMNSQTGI